MNSWYHNNEKLICEPTENKCLQAVVLLKKKNNVGIGVSPPSHEGISSTKKIVAIDWSSQNQCFPSTH